jgi:hypothetical protein
MSRRVTTMLLAMASTASLADSFVYAPSQTVTGTQEGTYYPFLIQELSAYPSAAPTMRYQQVCNGSLFTNLDPRIVYVTSLRFEAADGSPPGWGGTVPSMQINLATTTNTADHLSPVFSENVGSDDTLVFGPAEYSFGAGNDPVLFARPLTFHPPLGNLLIDVRIFNGGTCGFPTMCDPAVQMYAVNSPTDEVSRVWATNVAATVANGSDTLGLRVFIGLSPVPSLKALFFPSYSSGTETNIIQIRWPSQPTTFVLQSRDSFAGNSSWQPATNHVIADPEPGGISFIKLQAAQAGPGRFYRLIWPGGQ